METTTGESRPALFQRYPELEARIAWLALGRFPTPVERLRLEGFGEATWVKRDDLSGSAYGGNKVRKLEWLLAEAKRQGAQRLITVGAAGSHHALATTVYGRALGFDVTLVLFPQPLTQHVRDVVLLDHALGAELRFAPRMEAIPLALLAARYAHRRERCFVVAPGGSDPFGTLGYVSAALELGMQLEAGELAQPETVHLAIGTMGTAAGLAIGFALAELPLRIAAVRITSRLVTSRPALRRLVNRTLALLGGAGLRLPSADAVLQRVHVGHGFIGRGYGYETPKGRRAAALFARAGLVLDPTYTAKAAASLFAALEARSSRPHLFWHTLSASEPDIPPGRTSVDQLPKPFRRYLGASIGS
jgi:1-aminocyclopropane-1-carboxylate deaminase/D-cysteine desulfhydrase-like pyridoxal-dependent ACC family enzyme